MKIAIKRVFACILVLSMGFQLYASASSYGISVYRLNNPAPWAKEGTVHLLAYHIMEDEVLPKTDFNSITWYRLGLRRDHAAYLLVNLYEYSTKTTLSIPADYPLDAWPYNGCEDAVKKAYGAGLMQGKSETSFGYQTLTRQEFAVIFYRAAQQMGCKISGEYPDPSMFADEAEIAPWAREAVAYMLAHEIMVGTSETTYDPNAIMTHEMAYAGIHRFALQHKLYEKLPDEVVDAYAFTPEKPMVGSLTDLYEVLSAQEQAVVEQALALYPNPFEMYVFANGKPRVPDEEYHWAGLPTHAENYVQRGEYARVLLYAENGDFSLRFFETGIVADIKFAYSEYEKYQSLTENVIALSPYAEIHESRVNRLLEQSLSSNDRVFEITEPKDSALVQKGNYVTTAVEYSDMYEDMLININDIHGG